jgi:hypothetical protein
VEQSECPEWYEARNLRIIATKPHCIKTMRRKSTDDVVKGLLLTKTIVHENFAYGKMKENVACEE